MSVDPLLSLFTGTRRRLGLRLLTAAALGGCTALGTVTVFDAALLVLGHDGLSPLARYQSAAGLAGAGLAVLASSDWRKLLSPKATALAIDRKTGMQLGYATALETGSRGESNSIAKALIDNARHAVERLNPRQLWPILTPAIRALIIASVVLGGSAQALHVSGLTGGAALREDVFARSGEDIREDAKRLSDNLKREAIARDEPLLEAIARAMDERIAQAKDDVSAQELEAELDALIDQARAAFGDTPPSWLNNNRMSGKAQDGSTGASISGGPRNAPEQVGDDLFAINLDDLESARRQRQLDILEANGENMDETEAFGDISEGGDAPMSAAMSMQKLEPKQMQIAAREAVGASADSGKGPADQAGGGSSDLTGEGFASVDAGGEDMSLPQSTQETGRRIRISLPPSEAEQGLAAGDTGQAGSASGRAGTATVERNPVTTNRSVLARYFEKVAE